MHIYDIQCSVANNGICMAVLAPFSMLLPVFSTILLEELNPTLLNPQGKQKIAQNGRGSK